MLNLHWHSSILSYDAASPMTPFSPETTQLLKDLDVLSGHSLSRPDDLAGLVDAAQRTGKHGTLADLSFHAKFVIRARKIMTRIGRDAEGYENLRREFTDGIGRASSQLRSLVAESSSELQHHITVTYLHLSGDSLQNLLDLFSDLAWYKNWLIDHPDDPRNAP